MQSLANQFSVRDQSSRMSYGLKGLALIGLRNLMCFSHRAPTNKSISLVLLKGLLLTVFLWMSAIMTAPDAAAQVSCPNSSVRSDQVGWFAFSNVERGTASCTSTVAIPSNGLRAFSSWTDCRVGEFVVTGENSGGILPSPLTCTNCTGQSSNFVTLAPGTSAQVSGSVNYSDGARIRYELSLIHI